MASITFRRFLRMRKLFRYNKFLSTPLNSAFVFRKKCSSFQRSIINKELLVDTREDEAFSFVPISYIKQFLLTKDIVFSEGYTCLSVNCPVCENGSAMFINKISGSFICKKCKKSGSWKILENYLQCPKKSQGLLMEDESISYGRNSWGKIYETMQLKPLSTIPDNITHSDLKRVPAKTLEQLGAHVDVDSKDLYFPLRHGDDVSGYKRLSSDFSEETVPFRLAKGVITVGGRRRDEAIVVANLLDFLTLTMYSLNCDIVCLPHGQNSLPQEILPLFEDYKKLILWFDNDSLSWGNVKTLAKKLADERCYFIRPLENQPSPLECQKRNHDIMKIVNNAQPMSHTAITTFASLREDVLSELYNSDKVSGVKWERFPVLNSVLKGHRRGELTILTGPTGSGKTTFMSEYSLDLAMSKVTTLWGSFEIRNQRLAKTMMTQMFCASLEKNLNKFNEWADKFEILPIYFLTFHGQQSLNVVMEAVEHATYVHDVAHVIIDNVQFMLGLSTGDTGFLDRFYRQDALIASFRNFATTQNCHVTLVIHPRKEREGEQLSANSIFGGAKAAQEADNILIIQHKTNQHTLKIKKYLQVAKNRFSGDLGILPLEFNREALSFWSKK